MISLLAGRRRRAGGGRVWDGEERDGRRRQGPGLPQPHRERDPPAHLRPPAGALLQSSTSAALLRHVGRGVQAGRGLLLRHLLLLNAPTPPPHPYRPPTPASKRSPAAV